MWTIKSDERLELHDEEEDEVIAILLWDERALNWKLYYRYAGGSGYAYLDSVEGFGKLDIEPVEMAAVEELIRYHAEKAKSFRKYRREAAA